MDSNHIAVVDDDLYLSGIVKEYDDFKSFFNERTQNPNDFLTISELEERLNQCIRNTSENLRNAVSQWIREMDSREINRSKKANG